MLASAGALWTGRDMGIGGKLPINPWLFIGLTLLLTAIGAWNIERHMAWTSVAYGAAWMLQLAWIFQAGLYACGQAEQKSGAGGERINRKHRMIGALIVLAIAFSTMIFGFLFFANPETGTIDGAPALVFGPAMLLTFAAFFTLIFQAAKALCLAEEKNTGERVFVSCLLFLYLIIGAVFLFRRLKQLNTAAV